MGECICNSCLNLKSVIQDESEIMEYTCKFGLPSEQCSDCHEEDCNVTCANYKLDREDEELKLVKCKGCGKELEKVFNEDTDGDVFCIKCYLSQDE